MTKFARPKQPAASAAAPVRESASGRRFATRKPVEPVPLEDAYRGEPLALAALGDAVRRWSCQHCPGVIRDDGIAAHHYDCPYWDEHPDATPF